jgi:dTDP-4-dehydrorhamnose 3,5-epimerase-like enzyme
MKPIEGVIVDACRRVDNDRGYLQEIWRDDRDGASPVRQIYSTCTREGVVKAWYKHTMQVDSFFVLEGEMRWSLSMIAPVRRVGVPWGSSCCPPGNRAS